MSKIITTLEKCDYCHREGKKRELYKVFNYLFKDFPQQETFSAIRCRYHQAVHTRCKNERLKKNPEAY